MKKTHEQLLGVGAWLWIWISVCLVLGFALGFTLAQYTQPEVEFTRAIIQAQPDTAS